MSDKSKIEWTSTVNADGSLTPGATWNPTRGCSIVSEGCTRCYAMRQAHRFSGPGRAFAGLTVLGNHGPRWTGEVRFAPENLEQPLKWRRPRKIFVNSMSDLFHKEVTNEQIAAVFGVMAACPQHTFQILTKRAERLPQWFRWMKLQADHRHPLLPALHWAQRFSEHGALRVTAPIFAMPWPLPNVHLGVSVEDQVNADERIPPLLETPAAVRWISAEPLLGAVDLLHVQWPGLHRVDVLRGGAWEWGGLPGFTQHSDMKRIDWVVVGGESGPHARAMDLAWVESIVAQCKAAGVPVFVKQLGSAHSCQHASKGGCLDCMPQALRVREMPKEVR
jgi:protein gp37